MPRPGILYLVLVAAAACAFGPAGAKVATGSTISAARAHAASARVPLAQERATSAARIARAVGPRVIPPGLAAKLTPAWNQRMPWRRRGNVFEFLESVGPYAVRISEGLGFVVLRIRRRDGVRVVPAGKEPGAYAITAAPERLAPGAQPQQVHRSKRKDGRVALWQVRDQPDSEGFRLVSLAAYSDGYSLRYEIQGCLEGVAMAAAPPRPYGFGAPLPGSRPIRKERHPGAGR